MELSRFPVITNIQVLTKRIDFDIGRSYFNYYSIEFWVITAIAPFLLLIPSYSLGMAFQVSSIIHAFWLVLISIMAMLPWFILPTWFLLLKTKPLTRYRKIAYGWLGIILISVIFWIIIL